MEKETVVLFTRNGMGDAPAALQLALASKYLALLLESGNLPAAILFYTEGVRLVCKGSPVIDLLSRLEKHGVRIVLCKTCLDYFNLADHVQVGIIGGMGDILEAVQNARKVVSL